MYIMKVVPSYVGLNLNACIVFYLFFKNLSNGNNYFLGLLWLACWAPPYDMQVIISFSLHLVCSPGIELPHGSRSVHPIGYLWLMNVLPTSGKQK